MSLDCAMYAAHQGNQMSFKFAVGQHVEYTPIGTRSRAGLFTVTQHMPREDNSDRRYRIKSKLESFSRDVFEYSLSDEIGPANSYGLPLKGRGPRF